MKKIFNILWVLSCIACTYAQQYPIRITANAIPPYEMSLSRYEQSSEEKIQLQIQLVDLIAGTRDVYLKMAIFKGFDNNPMAQSNISVMAQTFTLTSGAIVTKSNIDLRYLFEFSSLTGINTNAFYDVLPDGAYRYCFTVYDAITNKQISNNACTMVNIRKFAPPFLNLPNNKTVIKELYGAQNILFQWVPSGGIIPNLKYEFTLKQLFDNNRDVNNGFLTGVPVYQTTVNNPTLLYDMSKPILEKGKRYAWQVKATSSLGNAFNNQGKSEIFSFVYVDDCKAPLFLTAQVDQLNNAVIRWHVPMGSALDKAYKINYRKKGDTLWEEQVSYQANVMIPSLDPQTVYEYRVAKECEGMIALGYDNNESFSFSAIQEFETPKQINDNNDQTNNSFQCGVTPVIDLSNQQPYQYPLGTNEVFMAGDFPVTVVQAEKNNEKFSGVGYTKIPYLKGARVKVKFKNVVINTNKRLISGTVETTYDMKTTRVDVKLDDGDMQDMAMCEPTKPVQETPVVQTPTTTGSTTIVKGESPEIPQPTNGNTQTPANPQPVAGNNGQSGTTAGDGEAPTTEIPNTQNPKTDAAPNGSIPQSPNNNADAPVAETKKVEFKGTELYAVDGKNSKRKAKSGETLYLINKPTLTDEFRKVNYELTTQPEIKLDELSENSIKWNHDNNTTNEVNVTKVTHNLQERNNMYTTSVTAGYPTQIQKSVDVKWVKHDRNRYDIAHKLGPILKAFDKINYFSKKFKKVGIPCEVSILENLDRLIGYNQFKLSYEKFSEEVPENRLYRKVNKFKFIATGAELFKLKCGKDITIPIPFTNKEITLAGANIEISAGLKGSIEIRRSKEIETDKVSYSNSRVSGGGYVKPKLIATLIGVNGKIDIETGIRFEYPYKNSFSSVGLIFYTSDTYGYVDISKHTSVFVTNDFRYDLFKLDTKNDFELMKIDIKDYIKN